MFLHINKSLYEISMFCNKTSSKWIPHKHAFTGIQKEKNINATGGLSAIL